MIFNFVVNSRMNRILIWFVLIFNFLFFNTTYTEMNKEELNVKSKIQDKHKWVNDKLYSLYFYRSKQYHVPIQLAVSVIKVESNGRKIVSRKNKNGTRDYGRFQVNSVHLVESPYMLLDDKLNSEFGFYYLSKCIDKSEGDYREAIRMYNQGMAGIRHKYKNWKYVYKILKYYKRMM